MERRNIYKKTKSVLKSCNNHILNEKSSMTSNIDLSSHNMNYFNEDSICSSIEVINHSQNEFEENLMKQHENYNLLKYGYSQNRQSLSFNMDSATKLNKNNLMINNRNSFFTDQIAINGCNTINAYYSSNQSNSSSKHFMPRNSLDYTIAKANKRYHENVIELQPCSDNHSQIPPQSTESNDNFMNTKDKSVRDKQRIIHNDSFRLALRSKETFHNKIKKIKQ